MIDCAREYRRDVRNMIPKQFKTTVGIMVYGLTIDNMLRQRLMWAAVVSVEEKYLLKM